MRFLTSYMAELGDAAMIFIDGEESVCHNATHYFGSCFLEANPMVIVWIMHGVFFLCREK